MCKREGKKHNIFLRVSGKNIRSGGHEFWLYNIGSDEIKSLKLDKIIRKGHWQLRKDNHAPTGKLLLSGEKDATLNFTIVGESLIFMCLSHTWSACVSIYRDDILIKEVDLYCNKSKMVEVIVKIGGKL